MNYCEVKKEQVIENFNSDPKNGLNLKQVESLKEKWGLNVLAEKKKKSLIFKFFAQFNDFMIIVLLVAAAVSFIVSWIEGNPDVADPIIILMIVVLNAVLGLLQESKAEKALEALKKMSTATAKCIRDGEISIISVEQLVPGDIVMLETGDIIPADGRVFTSVNLKVLESQLTGESIPVEKESEITVDEKAPLGDKINMVFSGSSVTYGRGKIVVCNTGMNTEVGKIAEMIMVDETPETPLQKRLDKTGKMLGVAALFICVLIFLIGIYKNMDPFFMFMTSVSLAVAAIPEGLPAIVTIMLAIGVQRMAKQNGIIRKLPVVETLGSATVICSDKTGTLTQNKMKVMEFSDANGSLKNGESQVRDLILKIGVLCNDGSFEKGKITGEPTEAAIILSGETYDVNKIEMDKQFIRTNEVPFDSKRKLMTTIHKNNDTFFCATKGAPDFLMERCKYFFDNGEIKELTANDRIKITKQNIEMAEKALRVLGVAYKVLKDMPNTITSNTIERDLIFVGLIGMIDPPRLEVKSAVEKCIMAGIKPVMVTGDHIITAKAIGEKIGIYKKGDKAISGVMLNEMSDDELCQDIKNYSIFARVSPEHKMRIVKAFQKNGEIVAMTGDGVNDAPALKIADIGCAMGITGTEVAKSAADMVLADDNFKTIVEAVREGRGIYANIKKAVHFLLSSNVGEIITIFVAIVLGWKTPLLAIHLLWVNLVTDSLPAIALGLDPADNDIMSNKAKKADNNLFSGGLLLRILIEGMMIGMLSLIAFGIGSILIENSSLEIGRTMAFATLSISQLVHSFNMRSEKSIFAISVFDNVYLIGAFIVGLLMQITVITVPVFAKIFKVVALNQKQWFIVLGLCILPLIIVELEKFLLKDSTYSGKKIRSVKRKVFKNRAK